MAKQKTYKVKNKSTKLTHIVPEGHFSLNSSEYTIVGKKPPKSPAGGEGAGSEGEGAGGEGEGAGGEGEGAGGEGAGSEGSGE